MRNINKMFVAFAIFATQQVFAENQMMQNHADDKPCAVIAKACAAAGFVKRQSETKGIWHNCMEPIILGQSVANVQVDPAVVKTCRMNKIKEMERQLEQLKKV